MSKLRTILGLGPSRRGQKRIAQAYQEECRQQRHQVEKQMFLRLLQTMCETSRKFPSWYHNYGGWDPGPVVRAFGTTPTSPIFEIHHETRRSVPNWYNIRVYQYKPEFKKIYDERCWVPDDQVKYVDAVFDLVRFGSGAIYPDTKQTLQELKNITDKHPVIWEGYDESRAIWYLKGLCQKGK